MFTSIFEKYPFQWSSHQKQSFLSLTTFCDDDWTRNKDDSTFASVYRIYLGSTPISWSSKKQWTVAQSSTKVKYRPITTIAV